MTPIADVSPKFRTAKNAVSKRSKKLRFRTLLDFSMLKGQKDC